GAEKTARPPAARSGDRPPAADQRGHALLEQRGAPLSASRPPRSGRLGTPVRPSDLPISRGRNGTDGQPMRISQLDVLCRTRGAHKLPDHGDEIVDGERLLERSDCPQSFGRLEFAAPLPEMAMIFTP